MPTRSSRNEMDEFSQPFNAPDFIHIYRNSSTVDWGKLKRYLENMLGIGTNIDIRENFLTYHIGREIGFNSIAEKLVRTKVFDFSNPTKAYDPFPVEIEHEKDLIIDPAKKVFGLMYDGFKLQNLFRELMPSTELSFKHLHMVFTNKSIGTWVRNDGRYHARVGVYGFPSIISTTGAVEAPAKPRGFYVLRKALIGSGMERELVEEELKSEFKGRFIDYNDERMTEIVKGYAMQAYFYHLKFDPFCEDKSCRLYNAHWQKEMIHAQLEGKDFCERHERILERIKERKK